MRLSPLWRNRQKALLSGALIAGWMLGRKWTRASVRRYVAFQASGGRTGKRYGMSYIRPPE
jgi:hypothetical protein